MTRRTHPHARGGLLGGLTAVALLASGLSGIPAAAVTPASDDHSARRTAPAGTMTYILGNNVWVANQDGTGARQVTTDGTAAKPYYSPTESDAGHIVAGRGDLIYRMDQWGRVLTTLDPPDLRSGGGETLGGPLNGGVAVSPDGATIAYSYSRNYCSFPNNVCKVWPVTGFTSATSLSSWETYGASYGQTPSWVTNTRVALDNRGPFDNLYLYDLGRGTVGNYWFDDANFHTDDTDLYDLEVSLEAPYAVATRGAYDQASIAFYDLAGSGDFRNGVPGPPDREIASTTTGLGIGSPSISADGNWVAWQEADGVWTFPFVDNGPQPALTIPGGSAPSLSRAALQTTRPSYPADPPGPGDTKSLKVKKAPKIKGVARVGARLRAVAGVFTPKPTSIRFQWLRDNKAIKGAKKATYKVTRKDRGHRLRVRVTAVRKAYATTVVTSKPVRVRR